MFSTLLHDAPFDASQMELLGHARNPLKYMVDFMTCNDNRKKESEPGMRDGF